ncbi:MAG: hypothetical protein BAA01_05290 [Bacillus thermozeamaize]|uniref:Leucine-binding protein domain-containing protein n=1 Tax=Bacillus thermozeamaize TaxID=230954 RepID=A0A1Y3PM96_9BACI|nr:MAG: hypothetical protein BAA01_05290 [Bacillus thermozeamaize]
MRFFHRRGWLVSLVVVMALLLAGCGGSTSTGGQANDADKGSGDTLKVGFLGDLSGPYADMGKESLDAIQTAVNEINEQGGLLGKKVELVYEDDELKPDIALRKAEKMVLDQGVKFLFGNTSSAAALALEEKLPQWGVLMFGYVTKSVKVTAPEVNENFFRACHNDDQDKAAIEDYLKRGGVKYQNYYLVGADYEWGHDMVEQLENIVKNLNGNIVGKEFTPLGSTEFGTVITNIRSKKPDVVLAALGGTDQVNFLKQVESFGLMKDGIDVIVTPLMNISLKAEVAGVRGPLNYHYSIDTPLNKNFVERFEKEHGYKPPNFGGEAYNAALMLFEAIKKSQSTDVETLKKTLEDNFEFETNLGRLKIDPETHQLMHPNYIFETVKDPATGKMDLKLVHTTPIEVANAVYLNK